MSGSISRYSGTQVVSFSGTAISSNGTFNNGSNLEGRFYNGAQALAGIYLGATAQDDVAFGGSKVSGTITP
ncbi:hypothetical protein C666_12085 [Thauera linaloolentis 47Lol = DSM 12138]|uniref:Transferrin-binding protein B C-lobe/N-lobe beta barrel domain-containing protein n=2 Tax=Thauera linaloolentis TaxID=76112 RepID=N6XYP0_THAL4|nr:hypothetical protein C666_12085 [Thauera linaloolentis 47Lol = DSM 12138]